MIGNNYLSDLYQITDLDTSINQLLEWLHFEDTDFLKSLDVPLDLNVLTGDEQHFLTIMAAIIDYCLQLKNRPVPRWLRDDRLCFEPPYFHSKRLTDFEKVKIQCIVLGPLKARQVYIEPDGLKRV